jgi:hypothetical protein
MCRSRETIFPANSFWQKNRQRDSFMTKVLRVDSFMTEAAAAQAFSVLADRRSLNFCGRIETSPHVGAIAANRAAEIFPISVGEIFSQRGARVGMAAGGPLLGANRYLPNSPDPRLRASLMWPKFGAGGFYRAS